MTKRSRDWDEGLSKDLQDAEFAQSFILASLEEGLSLQRVLSKVIRSYMRKPLQSFCIRSQLLVILRRREYSLMLQIKVGLQGPVGDNDAHIKKYLSITYIGEKCANFSKNSVLP